MMKINVLVTGAGSPGGPGIISALSDDARINIFSCDADINASGSFLDIPFYLIPKATSPFFIEKLLELSMKLKIDVIVPLVTNELYYLSLNKSLFLDEGINVIVSPLDSLKVINNKYLLNKHLESLGFPVPKSVLVTNRNELISAAEELGYPSKRIVFKLQDSNGSRGVRILDDKFNSFNRLVYDKPSSLISNLRELTAILDNHDYPDIMLTEYLPGDEVTVDCIVHKREVKIVLPRLRTKMNSGISTAGKFINDCKIIEDSKFILDSLNVDGPIGLQFKKNHNDNYLLIESNPRLQGTSVAALGLGINLPLIAVLSSIDLYEFKDLNIRWNTEFVRIYRELYRYE